jgi:predicted glycoside hydrolase/deacetylase ChbG (UPF0249 family)
MTKRIVLCADDYGQAEAVSKGILELVDAGRLTAVSCLVNQPMWKEQAAWLSSYHDKADIGLHLNFTSGRPLSADYRDHIGETFMSLPSLIWETTTNQKWFYREGLASEIEAQIDAFVSAMGFVPRFIDGHQHIQHLPLIDDELMHVYRKRLKDDVVYVRSVTEDIGMFEFFFKDFKNLVIHFTGGAEFSELLDINGVPHNSSFGGIYPFSKARKYRRYFRKFLRNITDHGWIRCHPGLDSDDKNDPIRHSRPLELAYLMSPEFMEDCQHFDVSLTRFFVR